MYTDTTGWEFARAVGLLLTITGSAAAMLLGGGLFAWEEPQWAILGFTILGVGVALLLTARARIRQMWAANRPYLLSEDGQSRIRGRLEFEHRLLVLGRIALGLFIVCAAVFFVLFNAIACGDRVDGFCGDVGRPPEGFMELWQGICILLGAVWACFVSFRRRHEADTERIDRIVAEGQRRRRNDHPMAGTDRFAWE